jgi:hypothetical protein
MAGLLDRVLPVPRAYTHFDGWEPPPGVAQRAQDVFGMDPNLRRYDPVKSPYGRMAVVPYPRGFAEGQEGPIDWTDWTAPQWVHRFAKEYLLPRHAWEGGYYTPDDVTGLAADLTFAGLSRGLLAPKAAGQATLGKGGWAANPSLGMGGAGPPSKGRLAMRENQARWDANIDAAAAESGLSKGLLYRLHETAGEGVLPPPLLGTKGVVTPPSGQTVAGTAAEYAALAGEGAAGRYFYPIGGETLKQRLGAPAAINPYAAALSQTSSQTPWGTNVQHSTKALNQFMAGQPVRTGKYPAAMSPRVQETFEMGGKAVETLGPKHGPFMESFGRYAGVTPWEKTIAVVNDIWNMRALGYGGDYAGTPTTGQHNFARLVASDAVKILNKDADLPWTVDMAQAAVWHTLRMREAGRSPSEAATDLRNVLDSQVAQAVHETVQGATTGSRMLGRTYQEKREFHDEIQAVLQASDGRDIIDSAFGLITRPGESVGGAFKGGVNPATVSASAVGQEAGAFGQMDAASRDLMEAAELTHALLKRQDAAAFTAPYYRKTIPLKDQNFFSMDIGRPLSAKETTDLYRIMEKNFGTSDMVPIGDYSGVWFSNYLGLPTKVFRDNIIKSVNEMFPGSTAVDLAYGKADGFYVGNNWSVDKYGENYFKALGRKRPHLQARTREILTSLGPGISKVEDGFIRRGWDINTNTRFWEAPDFKRVTGQAPIKSPFPSLLQTPPQAGFFNDLSEAP